MQHGPVNQGRCGECGDEWSLPRPRPHDEGGQYGNGVIGQTYTEGSVIGKNEGLKIELKYHF